MARKSSQSNGGGNGQVLPIRVTVEKPRATAPGLSPDEVRDLLARYNRTGPTMPDHAANVQGWTSPSWA